MSASHLSPQPSLRRVPRVITPGRDWLAVLCASLLTTRLRRGERPTSEATTADVARQCSGRDASSTRWCVSGDAVPSGPVGAGVVEAVGLAAGVGEIRGRASDWSSVARRDAGRKGARDGGRAHGSGTGDVCAQWGRAGEGGGGGRRRDEVERFDSAPVQALEPFRWQSGRVPANASAKARLKRAVASDAVSKRARYWCFTGDVWA